MQTASSGPRSSMPTRSPVAPPQTRMTPRLQTKSSQPMLCTKSTPMVGSPGAEKSI